MEKAKTKLVARSAFDRIESFILDAGGRMLGSSGKLDKGGRGLQFGYYLTASGRPIILQTIRGGSVEVYVPVTDSPRIDDTLDAIAKYAADDTPLAVAPVDVG